MRHPLHDGHRCRTSSRARLQFPTCKMLFQAVSPPCSKVSKLDRRIEASAKRSAARSSHDAVLRLAWSNLHVERHIPFATVVLPVGLARFVACVATKKFLVATKPLPRQTSSGNRLVRS